MKKDDHSTLNIVEGLVQPEPARGKIQRAVALEYERETDPAPRITAKGRGAVAEQILNIAFENGVKVREDAALTEILELLEVDSLIPLEAYAAVAEILSYVYRTQADAKQS